MEPYRCPHPGPDGMWRLDPSKTTELKVTNYLTRLAFQLLHVGLGS